MFILTTPIHTILEVLANATRKGKEIKAIQIRKKRMKLFLLTDDMNAYVANPEEPTKTPWSQHVRMARFQDTRLTYKSQLLSYVPAVNNKPLR